ncbi:MAG: helix-turn-helix domain-containing protein [Pyrinomonadaceae bacterium MAG19_C2-C3]|nr:helix-turn-helix domain-containing protein [Pyrinomonadaceae bacterium MAG19_C2-C3]
MGNARPRPKRLAAKLLQIRTQLDLTQEVMRLQLEYGDSPSAAGHISRFETGEREPSLLLLLRYAHLAGVPVDVLIDDNIDLPGKLPAGWKLSSEGKLRTHSIAKPRSRKRL